MPIRSFFIGLLRHVGEKKFGTLVEKVAASSIRTVVPGIAGAAILTGTLGQSSIGATIPISATEANRIGRRIWINECGGTVSGLTSWNAGENFASLGIGHFILYPRGQRGPFEESFPKLVGFVSARGAKLPAFLLAGDDTACPCNSRAEFLRDQDSPKMKQLRAFLVDTIDLQTEFLIARLEVALPKMLV